jgi:F-type H+-transporting ATPase subunit b
LWNKKYSTSFLHFGKVLRLNLDASTIIITILNVLLLYWFLSRKLFKPVTKFMNNRTESIQKNISDAEAMLNQAETAKAQYEDRLLLAEAEGKSIVEKYKEKAEGLYDEILKEANKEAELIRLRAKVDAEREMEKADDEIRKQVIAMALLAASKAVEAQLDSKSQHTLIKQFIAKVGM